MTTVSYTVPAIHCGHCTHTIEMEVGELQGVQSVKADQTSKKVQITRSRAYWLRSIILLKA
jgi:copper chaperone